MKKDWLLLKDKQNSPFVLVFILKSFKVQDTKNPIPNESNWACNSLNNLDLQHIILASFTVNRLHFHCAMNFVR